MLPVHAIVEFVLLCVCLCLVPFVALLSLLLNLSEKLPDMCWYKGGQPYDVKKRVRAKIQKSIKKKQKQRQRSKL